MQMLSEKHGYARGTVIAISGEDQMELAAHTASHQHRRFRDPYKRIRKEIQKLLIDADKQLAPVRIDPEKFDFWVAVNEHERSLIEEALRAARGNQKKAAVLLSIAESTLSCKIRAFEIDVEKFKRDRS